MTIGKSLINWLLGFEGFEEADLIETDQLPSESRSYGLYKQATSDVQFYVDGSRNVTDYYYLLARQSSKADKTRIENYEWMERLDRWVLEQNLKRALPALDDNRHCNSVGISVGAYMSEATDTGTAEYQVSIKINYTEVRK